MEPTPVLDTSSTSPTHNAELRAQKILIEWYDIYIIGRSRTAIQTIIALIKANNPAAKDMLRSQYEISLHGISTSERAVIVGLLEFLKYTA